MIQDQPEADFLDALSRNMNDYEIWSRKRIRFSITRHPPTPDTPLLRRRADSRVIYGPVWLKLIRARQNLLQEDLLTPIHFLTDHAASDVAYSECGGLYRTPRKKH